MENQVEIYTDGACRGNPGPGGWGVLLEFKGKQKHLYGGEWHTTNNRMELLAAIKALEALSKPCQVDLNTDSKYLLKGMTEWLPNWKSRGWKTASKNPVKNEDLWKRLDAVVVKHNVKWHWVRGHTGNRGNEQADRLANKGIDTLSECEK